MEEKKNKKICLKISNLIKYNEEYANIPEVIQFNEGFINARGAYHPNNQTGTVLITQGIFSGAIKEDKDKIRRVNSVNFYFTYFYLMFRFW